VLVVDRLRVETAGGADIVDEISFTVAAGEVLALVGESGCGKTSTALALLGHARPGTRIAGGSVRLAGRDLLRLDPAVRRRARGAQIAYVPQDPTAQPQSAPPHRCADRRGARRPRHQADGRCRHRRRSGAPRRRRGRRGPSFAAIRSS